MTNLIKFVVLTKSFKNTGFCVAGIDLDNGKLVRPVNPDNKIILNGALRDKELVYVDGKKLECLDVVWLPVRGKDNNAFQPENYIFEKKLPLVQIGKFSIDDVLNKFPVEEGLDNAILRSLDGKIQVGSKDDTFGDKSLAFIKVSKVGIVISYDEEYGKYRKTCGFIYKDRRYTGFRVTDPNYTKRGIYLIDNAYLVLSSGEPYFGYYYKWVAAIYPC